ncbi:MULTISPECIES: hypothetical protein [Sinobaca]|uniref:Uncharacterized protein n=1 Tax=Sinobaca qinghaiensis TaxID=342944 RepID=A0A419V402_9BACL|nr:MULTISPECIES: hypothetical protein [Sinobaca]RKD73172.1 hypothetical protein ATL39_2378 [Sinobaca qinghaiensis]
MELVKCRRTVWKALHHDYIEPQNGTILFQEGYVYPVFQDSSGTWLSTDEEGVPHVISETEESLESDPWFEVHFIKV